MPPARIAAALEPLRALEPEVVLAVDDRMDHAFDAGYRAVADRVLRVPFPESFGSLFGWLRTQCSGDWILQLDADEVPSPELAGALAEVIAAGDATHAFVPRRWLHGDSERYLAQWPWWPDYQLRLLRNDAALVRFPSVLHRPVEVIGPNRHLAQPLYHGRLLEPYDRRLRTVAEYDRLRPDLEIEGRSLNEALYLPERRPALRTARVPRSHRRAVRAWVAANGHARANGRPPAPLERVDPTVVAAHAERVELGDDAYRAELRLLDDDTVMVAGHHRTFDVEVRNCGDARWPGGYDAHPQIRLSYHWRELRHGQVFAEGHRTGFGRPVDPGDRCLVPAIVLAPGEPGQYAVEFDLVHEHRRWFGCVLPVPVEVVASR